MLIIFFHKYQFIVENRFIGFPIVYLFGACVVQQVLFACVCWNIFQTQFWVLGLVIACFVVMDIVWIVLTKIIKK